MTREEMLNRKHAIWLEYLERQRESDAVMRAAKTELQAECEKVGHIFGPNDRALTYGRANVPEVCCVCEAHKA